MLSEIGASLMNFKRTHEHRATMKLSVGIATNSLCGESGKQRFPAHGTYSMNSKRIYDRGIMNQECYNESDILPCRSVLWLII
jgi:hypothetical protein